MLDPRKVKQRTHARIIETVLADKRYSDEQRAVMKELHKYLNSKPNLSSGSKKNYMKNARRIILFVSVHPSKWTDRTIIKIVDRWRMKQDGSEYHIQYRNTVRTVAKYFLECFGREDLLQEMVHGTNRRLILAMINETPPDPTDAFMEEESVVITENNKQALLSVMNKRLRVIWSALFDTAARPDDLKQVKLSDIRWTHNGTRITLMVPEDTKTGLRPVRILESLPAIRMYLNHDHPFAQRGADGKYLHGSCALFLSTWNRPWSGSETITQGLRDAYKRVRKEEKKAKELGEDYPWYYDELPDGITARAIRIHGTKKLVKKGIRVDVIASQLGNSPMVIYKVYNRVNKRAEVESELDALVGVEKEKPVDDTVWLTCSTCSHINQRAQYCANCGTPLTEEALNQQDQVEESRYERLVKRLIPELREEILNELREEGSPSS